MKLAKGMTLIAEGWIAKPKGFRARFQRMTDGELVTGYSPPLEENPLDSDVTTWRYAWKLAMAARPEDGVIKEGCLVNVTVVDDQERPAIYYVTGAEEIFNPEPDPSES